MGTVQSLIRQGWCQGALAKDQSGRKVPPCSIQATYWSLVGALQNAYMPRGEQNMRLFRCIVYLDSISGGCIEWWQDQEGQKFEDVEIMAWRADYYMRVRER